MTTAIKHISWLYSKLSKVVPYTDRGLEEYTQRFKCSQCFWPNKAWMAKPTPIDVEVYRRPKGCCDVADANPRLLCRSLYELLRPHLRNILVGKCFVANPSTPVQDSGYVTICSPPIRCIEAHRGLNCRHVQCSDCGRFFNRVGWADGGIVRSELDDRRVYQSHEGRVFVDDALVEELSLREKFPDLRLYRYDILDKPLDGDTLRGDPGWTGVFVERPSPPLPPGKPRKGRWTQ